MKVPFVVYADTESLLEKIDTCYSNPENSSTAKLNKHCACSYSLFIHCSFDNTKNKHSYYKGEDWKNIFCKDFKKTCKKNN